MNRGAVEQLRRAVGADHVVTDPHDLVIFEPWFLVLGFLLALAGRWFAGPAASRRWTLSLVAAIVLIDAFGAALAVPEGSPLRVIVWSAQG